MRCPYCNSQNTNVIDSRPNSEDNHRLRRYVCNHCLERFSTVEIYRDDIADMQYEIKQRAKQLDKAVRALLLGK